MKQLVLASASPRRAELLRQIGVEYSVYPADIDESVVPGEGAEEYVRRVALEKAQALPLTSNQVVLAADTSVVCDHHILGKPQDLSDARRMLGLLSGRSHWVYTAFALRDAAQMTVSLVATEVFFRNLSPAEIDRYWATEEPQGKAGSYAIQGYGGSFVERIKGSYSAVVGLPLCEVALGLREFGVIE